MEVIEYLTTTGGSLADPLYALWVSFVDLLPGLIAAIIVILAGYLIGYALGWLVHKLLEKTKIDAVIKKNKLSEAIGGIHLSDLLGRLTKWYVFVIFLIPAASLINLGHLSTLLLQFAQWLPSLIAGIIIMIFGLLMATLIEHKMIHKSKSKTMSLLAIVIKVIIIVIFADIALQEIGIYVQFIENIFLILVAGLVLALALAFGIGFGLNMKGHSKGLVKKIMKKF